MAKVGPNAVNLAIAEMIGQLLTFTTHPNVHQCKRNSTYCSTVQYEGLHYLCKKKMSKKRLV